MQIQLGLLVQNKFFETIEQQISNLNYIPPKQIEKINECGHIFQWLDRKQNHFKQIKKLRTLNRQNRSPIINFLEQHRGYKCYIS
ncbi:unnamed protein product [Paramecium octaurelia]|uniref:Uncharacterized protein n=1 Tax=Paramecium octaurelia TaxID=43137 RepID=A0A8S1UXF0_PAROT|nr:unnamed protein product [Paramecium octaurelia]